VTTSIVATLWLVTTTITAVPVTSEIVANLRFNGAISTRHSVEATKRFLLYCEYY